MALPEVGAGVGRLRMVGILSIVRATVFDGGPGPRVSYRIFGFVGETISKVRDSGHSSPRISFLRFGLTIDFSIFLGGGIPVSSSPPP